MLKISEPYVVSAFAAYNKNGRLSKPLKTSFQKRKLSKPKRNQAKEVGIRKISRENENKKKKGVVIKTDKIQDTSPQIKKENQEPESGKKVETTKRKDGNGPVIVNKPIKKMKQTDKDRKPENLQEESVIKKTSVSKNNSNSITIENNVSNQETSTNEPEQLFSWLTSPIKANDFIKTFWEKKSVHIQRDSPTYYKHIFSTETFDRILRENSLMFSKNIDVVSYSEGVKEVYNQEGKATPSALWDYYSNGCSIRLLNPHTYNSKVHLLLATLQEFFGSMVGANVYLTPPDSQGFAPHFDDIEAFVVQLEGRKHWKLYNPKPSDVLCRESSPNLSHTDIGSSFMEVTLNAGDLLYFPRGTIHEGYTDADSHSLHITVSVYQHTSYVDLLEHVIPEALKKAAQTEVEFRKGLPLNYLRHFGRVNDGKNRQELTAIVENLVQRIVNYVDIDKGVDQLGRKFMYDSMPPVMSKDEAAKSVKYDGALMKDGVVYNKVSINLDTKVRLLRFYCIKLAQEDESGTCKLYYNTENANVYHGEEEQWLELDCEMVPVVEKLQMAYPNYVSIEQLPMDDVEKKLQLISDLWEHGIVISSDRLVPIE